MNSRNSTITTSIVVMCCMFSLTSVAAAGIVGVDGDHSLEGGWELFDAVSPWGGPMQLLTDGGDCFDEVPAWNTVWGPIMLNPVHEVRIPDICFAPDWGHGYEGEVFSSGPTDSVTYTMPQFLKGMDLYTTALVFGSVEFTVTAHASDGSQVTIQELLHSFNGSSHFGFYTTGSANIEKITIDIDDPNGIGVSEMRAKGLACPGEFTGDGWVNAEDLAFLLGSWGPCPPDAVDDCAADINGDDTVNAADLAILLGNWGNCFPV